MSLRIIDHKKVEMTNDEWDLYEKICKSYDDVNFKGSDLFSGLFESDDSGIIIFLRPPTKRTSFEVYLFMMSLMQHQHLRLMHSQIDDVCLQVKNKLSELDDKSKG
jgi:hypothetical protein